MKIITIFLLIAVLTIATTSCDDSDETLPCEITMPPQDENVIIFPDFGDTLRLAEDVAKELEDLGLRVEMRQEHDFTIPMGYFTRSNRNPGDVLEPNDLVYVWLSLGRDSHSDHIRVPDMIGLTINVAKSNATYSRLFLEEIFEESTEEMRGRITRQEVEPDTTVAAWSVIKVWVGTGSDIAE